MLLAGDGGTSIIYGPPDAVLSFRLECPAGSRQETSMDYDVRVALHVCKGAAVSALQAFSGEVIASRGAGDAGDGCSVTDVRRVSRSKFAAQFKGCRK